MEAHTTGVVTDTPSLKQFDPTIIPFQYNVIKYIRKEFDYTKGVLEVLLSGSVGSAKSLLMAHLAVTHCLMYPNAQALIGRLSMPALKDTLLKIIVDHLALDVSYEYNQTRGIITFPNNSRIICHSWSDKKYKKVRSYALSAAFIEELTENDDLEFYKEVRMRLNRIPSVKENILVCATNPDSPSHPAYEYFIEKQSTSRAVYYSNTFDNPFLDKTYIEQLKETLSPNEARRMLYGEWIEILTDIVYYNYAEERNFKKEQYIINPIYPVDLMFDFNIGEGKPMSAALGQYVDKTFHVAKTFIVHGARTLDICEEIYDSGLLNNAMSVRIFGDASGKNRDTRSKTSDYDIIKKFFNNRLSYDVEMQVPLANPPVRSRHNLVNSQFLNANNNIRCYIYQDAKDASKGFRLTKLKSGAQYLEDDSFEYQHVTTACGYWIYRILKTMGSKNRVTIGGTN